MGRKPAASAGVKAASKSPKGAKKARTGLGVKKAASVDTTKAFAKIVNGQMHSLSEEEVRELFRTMDIDDSGSITAKELQRSVEQHIEDPQIKKDVLDLLITADTTLDGTIDCEEFRQALLLGSQSEMGKIATKMHGMPKEDWVFRDTVVNYLETRGNQKDNFKSLPLTLLFFVIFFYLVVHHLEIGVGHNLSSSMGSFVTEKILNNYPDSLWAIVAQHAGSSRISRHNRVLGGLRMAKPPAPGEIEGCGRLCCYTKTDWFFEYIFSGGNLKAKPLESCGGSFQLSSWVHWPLDVDTAMERFAIGVVNETNASEDNSSQALAGVQAGVSTSQTQGITAVTATNSSKASTSNTSNTSMTATNSSNASTSNTSNTSMTATNSSASAGLAGWRRLAQNSVVGMAAHEDKDQMVLFPGLDEFDDFITMTQLESQKALRSLKAGGGGGKDTGIAGFFGDGGGVPDSSKPIWAGIDAERLQLTILTHNPGINWYTYVKLYFSMDQSGRIYLKQIVEAFKAQPVWMDMTKDLELNRHSLMGLDIVFLLMFLYSLFCELGEMLYKMIYQGCRKGFQMYWSVWSFIDWLNIFMVITIMVVYFHSIYLVAGLNQRRDSLPDMDEGRRYSLDELANVTNSTGIGGYEILLEDLAEQAERVVMAYKDLRWYVTVFSACSALKFFKAFRANPKLDVVTQTVVRASSDLLHFLIVFFALLMAFVLVAHILFGSQVKHFESSTAALSTCFLILIGYTFDDISEPMFLSGGMAGIVWAWIFNILMVLVLLNMVLAIIFDVYADIKNEAGDAPSLIGQCVEVFHEKRIKGRRLKEAAEELQRETELKTKAQTVMVTQVSLPENEPDNEAQVLDFAEEPDPEAKPELQIVPVKPDKKDPQTPMKSPKEQFDKVASLVRGKWNEAKLLDALAVEEKHGKIGEKGGEVITLDSLIQALGASESDKPLMKLIINDAREHSDKEKEIESMTLIDSIRLIGRIDANVRDILTKMRKNSEKPADDKVWQTLEEDATYRADDDLENRFRRIEDAVAGLTHKLRKTIGPAPPPVRAVPLPSSTGAVLEISA